MKAKWMKAVCLVVAATMVMPFAAACGGNGGGNGGSGFTPSGPVTNEGRALTISSGDFDGVFNPFFASSAYDSTIVGQTQIGLLGSDAEGKEVTYGEDYPVVALDYNRTMYDANHNEIENGSTSGFTLYQIVLKKDIKFSDGVPLTAHDVLFNMYMYLDPNYTGSNTMYSTDIVGLQAYLAQDPNAGEGAAESQNDTYNNLAKARINAIIANVSTTTSAGAKQTAINTYNDLLRTLYSAYDNEAIMDYMPVYSASPVSEDDEYNVESDLGLIRTQFREDLLSTYNGIDMTTYETDYSFDSSKIWQGFFYELGIISRQYTTVAGVPIYSRDENGKYIIDWQGLDPDSEFTRDEAIQYAYDAMAYADSDIASILTGFTTGNTMFSTFAGIDKEYYFAAIKELTGGLAVKNIEGIRIKDASQFKGDTRYEPGEYEMLEIEINGIDPKAVWNFAFYVAPMHYYSTPELTKAAMEDTDYSENFGVEFSSVSFQNQVKSRNRVPVGAGVYQASTMYDQTFSWATDENGNQTPASQQSWNTIANGFLDGNNIYLIRNDNFVTTGGNEEEVYNAKIKHLQYKVISTTNMINSLRSGNVDMADPNATATNNSIVQSTDYLTQVTVRTAGYGYIGINAKFIHDINVRRAIMSVMDVTLVQNYYPNDLSYPIYRPFSTTSWVYDEDSDYGVDRWEPSAYYPFDESGDTAREYLRAAGYTYSNGVWSKNGQVLEFTFTIAGDTIDHPAYDTFLKATQILAEVGIKATLVPDARALYKLASGNLAIWAAAWSSTNDPDMYQVYHRDSRATSVLNWGYDYMFTQGNASAEENRIMNELCDLIERGRETLVQADRALIYREAADKVMELAVELPVYQRSDMYVYNNVIIDSSSLYQNPSPYMSPISEIWKVSFNETE